MYNLALILTFIGGTALHIYFIQINQILSIPDSFAYLQMTHYLKEFSIQGFGTGWFGPLYSIPIAFVDFFINNDFLSAKIINIVLFFITLILVFKIGERYLNKVYNILFLTIFGISATFIHYNINILSENIYIPLFLLLFIFIDRLILSIYGRSNIISEQGVTKINSNLNSRTINSIMIGIILALMYLTRSEAFIYLFSIVLIIFILILKKDINIKRSFLILTTIFLSFFIFTSPYLFHLNNITGEWGLTNKGSSNIRQAEMRGLEKMDDSGFEKAVGELTSDNHYLKGGFAGGLEYNRPEENKPALTYFLENKTSVIKRFLYNQKKLYTEVLPKLILGDTIKSINNKNSFYYGKYIFFIITLIPFIFMVYGVYKLIFDLKVRLSLKANFVTIIIPLYIVASFFFTLFFTIDRYFLIFIPFAYLAMVYGIQEFFKRYDEKKAIIYYTISFFLLISIFTAGTIHYYTYNKLSDEKHILKKEAGIWIKNNFDKSKWKNKENLKIMERFPIVTYYSNTKKRFLTPFTNKLNNLIEYAKFNDIDILVVDTMDFKKYRPDLNFLLDETKKHNGLEVLHTIKKPGEKVILYKIKN